MPGADHEGWLVVGSTGRRQNTPAALLAGGRSEYEDGILVLPRDRSTGEVGDVVQALALDATWFVVANRDRTRLFSANEPVDGGECLLTSLSFDAGELRVVNEAPTGGRLACHVALSPTEEHAIVSHFASADLSVHPIGPDGTVHPPSQLLSLSGTGPHVRQEAAHAHQVATFPGGTYLAGVNLGNDEVATYTVTSAGTLRPQQVPATTVGAGVGPRNLVFASDGYAYLANELSNTLTVLRYDGSAGTVEVVDQHSTFVDDDLTQDSACGGIGLSPDERFLYVSNRGRDTIAAFAVAGGSVTPVHEVPVGGENSHDISLADWFVYAANTRSNTVTVLPIDPATGHLGAVQQTITLPTPMSVLAL